MAKVQKYTNPLLNERESTHGNWIKTAHIAQMIKAAMRTGAHHGDMRDAQAEALDLIATKIARIVNGNPNEPDHWQDISGYADLGGSAIISTQRKE